jgi:ZIP family zinc transporter
MNTFFGLIIPFVGTTLGSAMCFLMKNKMNKKLEKALLGFASGVMIAASVWSLIIPSIDMAEEQNIIAWIPASIGFLAGILFSLLLDSIIPHLHLNTNKPEGIKSKLKNTTMMILAVTIHNIPEGMAVRCCTCWSNCWKYWNNYSWCNCFIIRNCNTKLPRRSNYFYAIKSRRNV